MSPPVEPVMRQPAPSRPRRGPVAATASLLLAGALACGTAPPVDPGPPAVLPRPLTADELRTRDGGNAFTWALLRRVVAAEPAGTDVVLSPYSASVALGMVLNGARGGTYDAIAAALGQTGADQGAINRGYRTLAGLLRGLDTTVEWTPANAVWQDVGVPLRPAFADSLRTHFDATARTVSFADPGTPSLINAWVTEATRGRIPTLVERMPSDEVLFLVNAIHFKGRWRTRFDPARTATRPFTGGDGVARPVAMMQGDIPARVARTGAMVAVDLPYGNGAWTATAVMRHDGDVRALVAGLDDAAWTTLVGAMHDETPLVELPRLALDSRRTLSADLAALGMAVAFDPGAADFGGIADVGGPRLVLTRVLQRAVLRVDETGTEAAAATGVGVGVTSAPMPLTFDRPFLFVIRERLTGTVVFVAVVERLG